MKLKEHLGKMLRILETIALNTVPKKYQRVLIEKPLPIRRPDEKVKPKRKSGRPKGSKNKAKK
jgi:hypothetical protein